MSRLCGVDVGEVSAVFRLQTGAADGTGINYFVYITPILHEAENDFDAKTANVVNFLTIMNQIFNYSLVSFHIFITHKMLGRRGRADNLTAICEPIV
jgi:hypothetical protein